MGSVITLAALDVQKVATLEFWLANAHVRASGDGDHLFDAIDADRFLQFADPVICRATRIALIEINTPVILSRIAETSVRPELPGTRAFASSRCAAVRCVLLQLPDHALLCHSCGELGGTEGLKIQMKGIRIIGKPMSPLGGRQPESNRPRSV